VGARVAVRACRAPTFVLDSYCTCVYYLSWRGCAHSERTARHPEGQTREVSFWGSGVLGQKASFAKWSSGHLRRERTIEPQNLGHLPECQRAQVAFCRSGILTP